MWAPMSLLGGILWCIAIYLFTTALPFGHHVRPTVVSPDGRYQAQVYGSNCGATCGYYVWVNVSDRRWTWLPWPLPPNDNPLWPDVEETVLLATHYPCAVVPVWEGERELVIVEPRPILRDTARYRIEEWSDVKIQYVWDREYQLPAGSLTIGEDCFESGRNRYLRQGAQGIGTMMIAAAIPMAIILLAARKLRPRKRP